MSGQTDVLIIGGGLAGLTAALHLKKAGLSVTLIEKNVYPHHKVCGEYLSNEILPYFNWLGLAIDTMQPTHLDQLQLTTLSGQVINAALPLGGLGISRYALDYYLYTEAIKSGVITYQETANEIRIVDDIFTVRTLSGLTLSARQVIAAYGKRDSLDIKLNREFIKKRSPFLAVKAHYSGEFPNNLVALHNFKGGYCGVSKVENQHINICYLANYDNFKRYKNLAAFQEHVLCKNRNLQQLFENCEPVFDTPLTISQLSFGTREVVREHILMVGDTAGLIHPLCGNGMAMSIHGAKLCAETLIQFFSGKIASRHAMEKAYQRSWNNEFKLRLRMGAILSSILEKEHLTDLMLKTLVKMPFFLNKLIKSTHGKPIYPTLK